MFFALPALLPESIEHNTTAKTKALNGQNEGEGVRAVPTMQTPLRFRRGRSSTLQPLPGCKCSLCR
jgi:hypothetical protein